MRVRRVACNFLSVHNYFKMILDQYLYNYVQK